MVLNERRGGWELPGGSIKEGESVKEAAEREFLEESGYAIEILGMMDLSGCSVCACLLLERRNDSPEMVSELFLEVPERIAFDRSEYEIVVPWARSVVISHVGRR
jgi:8-oxo-dGTP diphosphatase